MKYILTFSLIFFIFSACNKDNENTKNNLPKADFSVVPQRAEVGDEITFDAGIVSDKEDALEELQVTWSWEGNNDFIPYTFEKVISHNYLTKGIYFPKLVVKDTYSLTDTAKQMVVIVSDVTNLSPTAPVQITPPEWQTWMNQTIDFEWYASNDPENDSLTYDLWIGMSLKTMTLRRSNITSSFIKLGQRAYKTTETGFLLNHDYYWQVAAKDSNGNYSLSWIWKFTTKPG